MVVVHRIALALHPVFEGQLGSYTVNTTPLSLAATRSIRGYALSIFPDVYIPCMATFRALDVRHVHILYLITGKGIISAGSLCRR